MEYSRKAKNINPSITLAITAKAKALKAEGVDVVSFGAGEPDFNTPKNIIDAAVRAMEEGKTKYTQTAGILELREAICNKLEKDNNLKYNTNQIIVSTGAKQCLADVFMATVFVEANEKAGYKYTIEDLEKVVSDKTKALVLNSPNNPTGTIYQKEELEVIAEFAKKHDILIISDEMYEKLIYDGEKHISIASLSQDAYERTIVINGVSKAYAMTGWRIGYAAGKEEIIKLMVSVQSHVTSNPNSIAQYASVEALNGPTDELVKMIAEFDNRRKFMVKRIGEIEGLDIIYPKGAFYLMINVSCVYGKAINGKTIKNSLDFSSELLEEEKVAVIPGAAFGLDKFIRLSYATSQKDIEEGLNRIENFIKKLK